MELTYIDRIKLLKSEKKITNDHLSELTGIPLGTLSKIMAGISDSPKLSNIIAICDALECSLDYIVSGTPENHNNYTLTDSEIRFIEDYRKLDDHGRELVAMVADKEAERIESQSYGDIRRPAGIIVTPKYKATGKASSSVGSIKERSDSMYKQNGFGKRAVILYELPVSAGTGMFLDGVGTSEIMIPDTAKTGDADYALRISGNSMEPKYHNGDILLVEETDTVEVGEAGIFILDGAGYFKIFGGDRLISLNPEYSDIPLRDFAEVACCGKVVGKLKRK
jgi:phage repressor protein C with HTH and peptisase S24 domain/DNA-binding Xre family transcriptional regulator